MTDNDSAEKKLNPKLGYWRNTFSHNPVPIGLFRKPVAAYKASAAPPASVSNARAPVAPGAEASRGDPYGENFWG